MFGLQCIAKIRTACKLYEESDADLSVRKKLALTNRLKFSIKIDIVFTNAITEEL